MGTDPSLGSRPPAPAPNRSRRDGSPPLDAGRDGLPDRDGLPGRDWVASQRREAGAMGAGLQFGLVLCLFAFAGLKLDGHFGTKPWLLVAGVVVGFTGGTISLLKKFK